MSARNTAAAALDTTVSTLKTQLTTYLATQDTANVPHDDPARIFWNWFTGQMINHSIGMAQAVRTVNQEDPKAWGITMAAADGTPA